IFSTLAPSLRKRLVDLHPTTAKDAWTYIAGIFQDNKRPRVTALKAELRNNLLSWSSKRQPTLYRSSVEAEYRGVANAVAETCWIRNLLRELHTPLSSATIVYCDNRTKHIEIDIHFVRDLVA
nr:ribonuclease H-like domain-containing protein [Tanacetum cinerariifolium]GFB95031.1 ribonuclease H-like domain-containing protein [Tanacetum cinerariifolium]